MESKELSPKVPEATEEVGLLAPVYHLPRLELLSGRGARVRDIQGREYLDFVSGIAVNALGHAPPGLVRAVAKQMRTLGHCSNLFANRPAIELAQRLRSATGYDQVFYCNSGSEAVESALKFARAHARARGREGRAILAFEGSVTNLIPLYTVGVFVAFTLSQSGMVRHWWRLRDDVRGWQIRAVVNGLGAATTAAGAKRLLILVEKNPNIMTSMFELTDAIEPAINTRVKMGQSSNVFAVAMMGDGRVLYAQKEVKVTLGGCGG